MPSQKVKTVEYPSKIDGAVSRLVQFEDGSGGVQTWSPREKAWKPGGATIDEFFFSPPATPEFMRSKGIPEADIEEMTKSYRS